MNSQKLLLASKSQARHAMLKAAGITFESIAPSVDEDALKKLWKADCATADNLANILAKSKALSISERCESDLTLGADQVLVLDDGSMLDKPSSRMEAKKQLIRMSGTKHKLFSSAVLVQQGAVIWSHVDYVTMSMRNLSDSFVDHYVEQEWDNIRHCVGCYEIEGRGVQLFSDIDGNQFTIMGLPLLPLLDCLRERGVIPS